MTRPQDRADEILIFLNEKDLFSHVLSFTHRNDNKLFHKFFTSEEIYKYLDMSAITL